MLNKYENVFWNEQKLDIHKSMPAHIEEKLLVLTAVEITTPIREIKYAQSSILIWSKVWRIMTLTIADDDLFSIVQEFRLI